MLYKKELQHPVLVELYHPDCSDCKVMTSKFITAAQYLAERKYRIETIGLNWSQLPDNMVDLVINKEGPNKGAFPDIRLYTKTGKYESFQDSELEPKALVSFI